MGIDQVQNSILNVNLIEKTWEKYDQETSAMEGQENKPNIKE
jgi:hypothetical protein